MEKRLLGAVHGPVPSQFPWSPEAVLAGTRVRVQEEPLLGPLWTAVVATDPFLCPFLLPLPLLDGDTAAAISFFPAAVDEAGATSSRHNICWVLAWLLRRIISAL